MWGLSDKGYQFPLDLKGRFRLIVPDLSGHRGMMDTGSIIRTEKYEVSHRPTFQTEDGPAKLWERTDSTKSSPDFTCVKSTVEVTKAISFICMTRCTRSCVTSLFVSWKILSENFCNGSDELFFRKTWTFQERRYVFPFQNTPTKRITPDQNKTWETLGRTSDFKTRHLFSFTFLNGPNPTRLNFTVPCLLSRVGTGV